MIERSSIEQRHPYLRAGAFTFLSSALLFASVCACAESTPSTASDSPDSATTQATSEQAAGTSGPQSTPSRAASPSELEEEYREPTADELQREPLLRERVKARWAALIDGDFNGAYEFTTPSYRAEHDAAQHADSYGDLVQWHLASVQEVRYDRKNEAEVIVSLTISVPLNESGTVKTTVPVPEKWSYIDDQWYFTNEVPQP